MTAAPDGGRPPGGRLDGRVALISGGARGQGAAEAALFVAEGASVVVGDVLEEEGHATAESLGDAGRFVPLDVTDESAWLAAVATAEKDFGRLDILVNNAGILKFTELVDTDVADFRRVVDVNLTGTFLGMKTAAPALERAGGGAIVNISSIGGLSGLPSVGSYVASKWAVRGLTKTAAIELGPKGIRVNSVHPGAVNTPMVAPADTPDEVFEPFFTDLPIRRVGTVDDIAAMVLFLVSDDSTYCTGAEFVVDGGKSAGDPGFLG